jgi:hypothetical protein
MWMQPIEPHVQLKGSENESRSLTDSRDRYIPAGLVVGYVFS